jgi:hypothetical protein
MNPDETFRAAIERVGSSADRLLRETEAWSSPHEFRFVSAAQAKPAANAVAAWIGSGSVGQPSVSRAALRAAMYDISRIGRQVSAFPTVSCLAVRELTIQLTAALQRKSGLAAMVSMRGIFERVALATWLSKRMEPFNAIERPTFEDAMDNAEPITRALYGTGLGWITIAGSNLRTLKAKDAAYKRVESSASTERIQILSAIDAVDKNIPGSRLAYEILCDFLHPNVGDLFSATTGTESLTDELGTRHLIRRLGPPEALFHGAVDVQGVIAQVFEIFGEVTESYPTVLEKLDKTAVSFERVCRSATHRSLRKQRHLFKASDLCPCNSGKSVRRCGLSVS